MTDKATRRKFRKKPVVIEAVQWDESLATYRRLREMGMVAAGYTGHADRPNECRNLRIVTLEGSLQAKLGDWIVCGIKGEFYPVRNDIFEATYEPVE